MEKVYNKFRTSFHLPNIDMVAKSRKLGWIEHVAKMKKKVRSVLNIVTINLEDGDL